MILVDTNVWIDHFHRAEPALIRLLDDGCVAVHPMVLGELSLGSIRGRAEVLSLLQGLRTLGTVTDEEFLTFVEERNLMSRGLSYVDVHLLASVLITTGARLWTRDRRLRQAADELRVAAGTG